MTRSRRFFPALIVGTCVTAIAWTSGVASAAAPSARQKLPAPPWKTVVKPSTNDPALVESADSLRAVIRSQHADRFLLVDSEADAAVVYEVTARQQYASPRGQAGRIEGRLRIPGGAETPVSYEAAGSSAPAWPIVAELLALDIRRWCEQFAGLLAEPPALPPIDLTKKTDATKPGPPSSKPIVPSRSAEGASAPAERDLGIDVAIVKPASAAVYAEAAPTSKVVKKLARGQYAFLVTRDQTAGFLNVVLPDSLDEGWIRADAVDLRLTAKPREKLFTATPTNSSSQPVVEVFNDTDKTITLAIAGKKYAVGPKLTQSIVVQPGTFNVVCSAPGVLPYVGTETWESGQMYKVRYYIGSRD